MEKLKANLVFIIVAVAAVVNNLNAQTLINLDTVTYHGTTDTASYMPIQINNDGKIILSGNQKLSSAQYDASTSAQLPNLITSWVNSYNASTLKCFVTASTHDFAGNIYNVGAVRTAVLSNGLDIFVQKIDPYGNVMWTQTYNGTGSSTDVAAAVAVDGSGDVYVVGAVTNNFPDLVDIITKKYDTNGNEMWSSTYDYGNLIDIPTAIDLHGGDVKIAGFSGSSFTNNDLVVVKYDMSSGSQLSANRTMNTNTGAQDILSSMAADSLGNVYTVGRVLSSGNNYNMQLQKLDTSLTVLWTQTFDGFGFEDIGINLDLDDSLNIYVTGYSYKSNTSKQLSAFKYNNNGTLQWVKFPNNADVSSSEGLRIKVKNPDEIFIGGNITQNSNQDVCIIGLDRNGRLNLHKTYNGVPNGTDKFMDFTLDNSNHIYVSARSATAATSSTDNNIIIQYHYNEFAQTVGTLASGAKFEPKELIVEFDKKALKMNKINDREFLFGKLADFVCDSTCNKITMTLDPDGHLRLDAKKIETRKIFYSQVESDSLSQTRSGNYINVPKYYCYLLLTIPPTISNVTAKSSLYSTKPDIHTTQYNFVYEPANSNSVNDPLFAVEQAGLHPTTQYPNSHINVDSAWTTVSGEPNIRVGVYDTGIDFTHPDFSGLITMGKDFITNLPSTNVDDGDHGTGIAGIISAVKNNGVGIAGIAGRDAATSNQGVKLYDCKVCDLSYNCFENAIANGIVQGLQGTNIGGYALNVMNLSIRNAYSYFNTFYYPGGALVIKAMNDANRNGVAIAAAKGNLQFDAQPSSIPTYVFPGDYSDETTMSVGSTGRNGEHCIMYLNCSNASTIWGNIDFSAPGTDSLAHTLNDSHGYKQEDGTSIATPHVSGASALMMSYWNKPYPHWDNLVHEDCENILQRTCKDLTLAVAPYNQKIGYDSITGWGSLNVNRAIREINKNYYRLRHITESIGSTSVSRAVTTVTTNANMRWIDLLSIPNGYYSTDVYKLTSTINFVLQPGEVIIDFWPLNKECYGIKLCADTITLDRPYYSKIISMTNTQAVLETYYYRYNPNLIYMPTIPTDVRQAFTLYTYDSTGTVGIKDELVNYTNFVVYPNPSKGLYDVAFNSDFNDQLTYSIFNLLGQKVQEVQYKTEIGRNTIKLNMNDFANGVYILNIFDNNNNKILHRQKIIKN